MDDPPGPLTARKYRVSPRQSSSSSSCLSFPQIPRRSSSLSASESNDSSGPVTSTRTPSLSDSLYQIEIPKIRQSHMPDYRTESRKLHLNDDPFTDKDPTSPAHTRKNCLRGRNQMAPQLVVRWSSGSWNLPESPLCARSIEYSVEPGVPGSFPIPPVQPLNTLCPMDPPIVFTNVTVSTKRLQIGILPESLWTTIQVNTDINTTPFPASSSHAPLDIIILLDTMVCPSVNSLTQVTLGSSVLASHLVYNHDRIAVAFTDHKEKSGFKLLLPLGHHSTEATRSALSKLSQRQLFSERKEALELSAVIPSLCEIFYDASRDAFCHLFFVSATPPARLSIPWTDQGIGFHTVTPCPNLSLDGITSQQGWHISYSLGASDTGLKETRFIRKVSKVLRQLRTGIRPGSIANLSLSVTPSEGCKILSGNDHFKLSCLRPGETWSVPIQVRVPAVEPHRPGAFPVAPGQHPLMEEMFTQINFLLQEYSSVDLPQQVLVAHVQYQHSLLMEPNTVHVETELSVLRRGYN